MQKHNIKICLGSSCFSRGNSANVKVIKQFILDNALDAKITFTGRLCENMCSRGPVIVIDDKVYENVNLSRLCKILKEEFKC
ncbi:MAG: NADH dehydrogenase [Bacteroidetes bacterium GWE2_39_28]|jgi:NADH:ubiquinone oxidoreductase subunit E|nr:MAG: NADH dehydrogenase [Bacteroidetes bacterium GWE2_39_28]OFY12287.1 MAG: NADH dehydrogenase [Bacteroidetes bacterium GWF2_39_10]OFZ08985.1 MAG: NADH dehydrogenase [Bacteroidetes bacterium RIFOXYB2_FULL_39_7]OFZ11937.1 MAG: NADH dehydrogenase [Bacteroidetes bacterium RIFOXYC2_FULL_39_11]HCT95084.1 electron transport complex protein RnfG [Rikenellaceae bacterium]